MNFLLTPVLTLPIFKISNIYEYFYPNTQEISTCNKMLNVTRTIESTESIIIIDANEDITKYRVMPLSIQNQIKHPKKLKKVNKLGSNFIEDISQKEKLSTISKSKYKTMPINIQNQIKHQKNLKIKTKFGSHFLEEISQKRKKLNHVVTESKKSETTCELMQILNKRLNKMRHSME